MNRFLFAMGWTMVALVCLAGGSIDFQEYAISLTALLRPQEWLESKDWWVNVCPLKSEDGDKSVVCMSSKDQWYRDGGPWSFWRKGGQGRISEIKPDKGKTLYSQDYNFYNIEAEDHKVTVICLNAGVGYYDKDHKWNYCVQDVKMNISDEDRISMEMINGGLERMVLEAEFRRVNRSEIKRFGGFDCSYTSQELSSQQIDDGIKGSSCLSQLVNRYRDEIKVKEKSSGSLTVYGIVLDANNDGVDDVYLTSEVERVGTDEFAWHLYLGDGKGYTRATGVFWFNKNNPSACSVEAIKAEESAGKYCFYQVVFKGNDPAVVILDGKRDVLMSRTLDVPLFKDWSVSRPKDESDGYDSPYTVWKCGFKDKFGFWPPMSVRAMLCMPSFVEIRRLVCYTFKEGE